MNAIPRRKSGTPVMRRRRQSILNHRDEFPLDPQVTTQQDAEHVFGRELARQVAGVQISLCLEHYVVGELEVLGEVGVLR